MLRKFAAGILSALFVFLALPLIYLGTIYSTVSDRDFWQEEVVEDAYALLLNDLPPLIKLKELPTFKEEDYRAIFKEIMSEQDLGYVVADFIEQFSILQVTEENVLEISFSLKWLVNKKSSLVEKLVEIMYQRLPQCTREQMSTVDFEHNFECVPANDFGEPTVKRPIADLLERKFFDKLPERYAIEIEAPTKFGGENLKNLLERTFLLVFLVDGILLAIILILMALILWKPWQRILRWELKTIFSAAFIALAGFLFLSYAGNVFGYFEEYLVGGYSPEQQKFMADFLDFVFAGFAKRGLLYAGLLILVSGGGWMALHFFGKSADKQKL